MLRAYFVWLFSLGTVLAQYYETTQYADHSGLPSRIVRDIAQDSKGYLWVAGNNGLFKFDGQKFWPYYASLKDTIGLRDNKINTLLVDQTDRVWIATPKGLHWMENDEIHFFSLLKNPTAEESHIIELFQDSKGNIWVGTYGGLFMINSESGETISFSAMNPELLEDHAIWGIDEDSDGRLWISRAHQLPLISGVGNFDFNPLNVTLPADISEEKYNAFNYLEFDENLFLIDTEHGLLKGSFNSSSNLKIEKFKDEKGGDIEEMYIYETLVDHDSGIWVVTRDQLYKKYELKDGWLIEQEVISKNGILGMSGYSHSIFQDLQDNIWIANANGLFKLSEDNGKITIFPPSHVYNCIPGFLSTYTIVEDRNGYVWLTSPRSLYRFKKEDILSKDCPEDYLYIENSHFKTSRYLFIDSSSRLWLGAENGLSVTQLDANSNPGEFFHFTSENGLPHTFSFSILEENPNHFWIANYSGLVKMTLPQGDIAKAQFKVYGNDKTRNDALVNNYVQELEFDRNGNLWAGTFSGVSKLINAEGQGNFQNFTSETEEANSLSNNAIKQLFKDSNGRLWIGTQTGLNLFDEERDGFLVFGRSDGLPSEYILGIQEDSEGFLWVATTQGLFKGIYNESMKSFVHVEYFTVREGLADNITNRNGLFIDQDDNVFIGSSRGLSVLTTSEVNWKAKPFNLALTKFESIKKKDQGFSSVKDRIEDQTIKLKHNENSIQLSYAALDFTNPEYNRYRHKILPVREDWIETGATSELNYYNLSPGTYELILDGSNNLGIWSAEPIQLKVIISPPFWKSNFAIILYILLLGGLLRFFYLARIKKREQELAIETKLEKALIQEREQLRKENTADFHDELGSKVTKISLFLTLAERSLRERKDPSQWFVKIRNNIKDLSGSFRDLLWVIDPQKDSLGEAFLRLKDFGEDLFNNSEVDFRSSGYHTNNMDLLLDPQTKKQVVMIFKEAMNNCAKYAECDRVELKLISEEDHSTLILNDNGKGFNVQTKSKGRGLKNMMDRAKKIGSEMVITSSEKGTIIRLEGIPHSSDDFHLEAM
ncbi:MAG: hypothetical protein HKN48_12455 [Flavobacteriaceae bacterium]|nr:hypothetical protein [Flavobacteriaceae bacterium]